MKLVFLHELDRLREAHISHPIVLLLHHYRSNICQTFALLIIVLEVCEDAQCLEIIKQGFLTVVLLESCSKTYDLRKLVISQI